jgi:hypothetical protein
MNTHLQPTHVAHRPQILPFLGAGRGEVVVDAVAGALDAVARVVVPAARAREPRWHGMAGEGWIILSIAHTVWTAARGQQPGRSSHHGRSESAPTPSFGLDLKGIVCPPGMGSCGDTLQPPLGATSPLVGT